MNREVPKAWIPAYQFTLDEEIRYLNLFRDLIANDSSFQASFWRWGERDMYEHSIDGRVSFSKTGTPTTHIELVVLRRFHGMANVQLLEQIGFKRLQPTSPRWNREFIGQPSPDIVANYLFAGIKFLVDFKPNLGFTLAVEDGSFRQTFEETLSRHNAWGMPSTGDLMFLNT